MNGAEELQQLFTLCSKKKLHVGIIMEPQRSAEDVDKEPADLILVVADGKPVADEVILSDRITKDLATSATFLINEVKNLKT